MKHILNTVQWDTFEKSHIKPGPSNMLLRCTIYLTMSKDDNQKYLKRTFEKSHMISGQSNMVMMSYLLNTVHCETFEKSHMKSGPTNMVLICSNLRHERVNAPPNTSIQMQ